MSDNLILAALLAVGVLIYLMFGAIVANVLGVEDTLFRIGVVLGWPIVLVFIVVLVMIGVRIIGATSKAIRGWS